jgi:hypothetical protein
MKIGKTETVLILLVILVGIISSYGYFNGLTITQDRRDVQFFMYYDDESVPYGQGFELDKGHVDQISFYIHFHGITTATIKSYLYETMPPVNSISSYQTTVQGSLGTSRLVTMPVNLDLTAGNNYFLVVYLLSPQINYGISILGTATNPYSDGMMYYNDGSWHGSTERDLCFQVGTSEVNQEPVADFYTEPSSPVEDSNTKFISSATDDDAIKFWRWKIGSQSETDWLNTNTYDYTFVNKGTYLVTHEVKDTGGLTDTCQKYIIVKGSGETQKHKITVNTKEDTNDPPDGVGDTPITGCTVYCTGQSSQGPLTGSSAVFSDLVSGSYTICVTKAGFGDWSSDVSLGTSDVTINSANVDGATAATVTITVLDSLSNPISGAKVTLTSIANNIYDDITTSSGMVIINDVVYSTYRIVVEHADYDSASQNNVVISGSYGSTITLQKNIINIFGDINILALIISIIIAVFAIILGLLLRSSPRVVRIVLSVFLLVISVVVYFMLDILGVTL